MAASPYGFRTSPITSDLVVGDSIRLEQVALDGDAIYWSETQPQKQGRTFVYRVGADGEPERVTPDDANAFSIRTRAHEYGGGSFAVSDGVVYFSNNLDQRLYRQDAGRPPIPITPAPTGAAADALRYADGVIDRRRGRMVCVSDRVSGWWNLYRERDGAIEPMAEMDAEFGRPQWQFGMSTYAFESADRLISCFVRDGVWTLVGIDTRSKRFDVIPTEFTDIAQLRAAPGRLVFIGGSPSEAPALVDLDLNKGTHRVLLRRGPPSSRGVDKLLAEPNARPVCALRANFADPLASASCTCLLARIRARRSSAGA